MSGSNWRSTGAPPEAGDNSGDDPGPDKEWNIDPRVHWVTSPVSPDDVTAFVDAVRQQGPRETRLAAIDQALWRQRARGDITGMEYRIYSTISDLSKMGHRDGHEPRCALLGLERIAALSGDTSLDVASRAAAALVAKGAVAALRFMHGKRRLGYFTPVVTAEDRRLATSAALIKSTEGLDKAQRELARDKKRNQRASKAAKSSTDYSVDAVCPDHFEGTTCPDEITGTSCPPDLVGTCPPDFVGTVPRFLSGLSPGFCQPSINTPVAAQSLRDEEEEVQVTDLRGADTTLLEFGAIEFSQQCSEVQNPTPLRGPRPVSRLNNTPKADPSGQVLMDVAASLLTPDRVADFHAIASWLPPGRDPGMTFGIPTLDEAEKQLRGILRSAAVRPAPDGAPIAADVIEQAIAEAMLATQQRLTADRMGVEQEATRNPVRYLTRVFQEAVGKIALARIAAAAAAAQAIAVAQATTSSRIEAERAKTDADIAIAGKRVAAFDRATEDGAALRKRVGDAKVATAGKDTASPGGRGSVARSDGVRSREAEVAELRARGTWNVKGADIATNYDLADLSDRYPKLPLNQVRQILVDSYADLTKPTIQHSKRRLSL